MSIFKRRMGRPKYEIDWTRVDQDLIAGYPGTMIADSLGIGEDTLYRACEREFKMTFSAYSQQKRAVGDKMIHKSQFEVAVKDKNPSMLIWLGKQRLGQREPEKEDSVTISPEAIKQLAELMCQLKLAQKQDDQDALRDPNSNKSIDCKSECVTGESNAP